MHTPAQLLYIPVCPTSLLISLIGTFDVKHVDTSIHEGFCGYTDVTCYFAKESDAKGCRIVIQTLQGVTSCVFVASREEEEKAAVTVALPNGTYTLLVYDEEDGAVHNPAFTTVLHIMCGAQVSGIDYSVLWPTHHVIMHFTVECTTVPSDYKSESESLNTAISKFTKHLHHHKLCLYCISS